jgi:chitin disaccharide deacetylase
MSKRLIVNADDFGLTSGVNRGIIDCVERGIVTSASLMVRQRAVEQAAEYARRETRLSVGLHLDLGEWVYSQGAWIQVDVAVPMHDEEAVRTEVWRQMAEFCRFVGRNPSHLDSHQHVHRDEPVRSELLNIGRELGIPVREFSQIRYCGDFYGQDGEGHRLPDVISVGGLEKILITVGEGLTELGCHPGYPQDLASVYREERQDEVRVLCDPAVRDLLSSLQIETCRFGELL